MNAPFRLNTDTIWTDDRVEKLKELWRMGYSCSQCAGMLGDVTRNAIIGKVHRLGLERRSKTPRRRGGPRRPRAQPRFQTIASRAEKAALQFERNSQRKAFYAATVNPDELNSFPVDLMELNRATCKWPLGEPDEPAKLFCGAYPEGRTFCRHHHRIAHAPPLVRQPRSQFRLPR